MRSISRFTASFVAAFALAGCMPSVVVNNTIEHAPQNVQMPVHAPHQSLEATVGQLGKDLAQFQKDVEPLISELKKSQEIAALETKIAALGDEKARLEADLAKADAKIAAMEKADRESRRELAEDANKMIAEIDKALEVLAKNSAPESATIGMPVPPESVPAASGIALVQLATITTKNSAEGWYAWKRQSQEYKKAHPWEGKSGVWCTNSTRLGIPCTEAAWKKVPAGTIFLLPAPEIRVYVPQGVEAPKAITLVPTENAQLFKLDTPLSVTAPVDRVVVKATEEDKAAPASALDTAKWKPILVVFGVVVSLIALFFAMKYLEERDAKRELEAENARLKKTLAEIGAIARKAREAGCCGTEPKKDGCCEPRGPSDLCDPSKKGS